MDTTKNLRLEREIELQKKCNDFDAKLFRKTGYKFENDNWVPYMNLDRVRVELSSNKNRSQF